MCYKQRRAKLGKVDYLSKYSNYFTLTFSILTQLKIYSKIYHIEKHFPINRSTFFEVIPYIPLSYECERGRGIIVNENKIQVDCRSQIIVWVGEEFVIFRFFNFLFLKMSNCACVCVCICVLVNVRTCVCICVYICVNVRVCL